MDDKEKRNREKLKFFYNEKVRVHIERKDRQFWNGVIVGKKTDDIYLFKEDKFGEMHLFVTDVWEVEEYRGDVK